MYAYRERARPAKPSEKRIAENALAASNSNSTLKYEQNLYYDYNCFDLVQTDELRMSAVVGFMRKSCFSFLPTDDARGPRNIIRHSWRSFLKRLRLTVKLGCAGKLNSCV